MFSSFSRELFIFLNKVALKTRGTNKFPLITLYLNFTIYMPKVHDIKPSQLEF